MDTGRFDRLSRAAARVLSRRATAGILGIGALALPRLVEARKKKRKHRKRKQKVTFNEFGCVDVGAFCKNGDQCCSGICTGKKDKKKCQAHDATTCQGGKIPAVCGGDSAFCISSAGFEGACATTTGGGDYCFASGDCFACTKDVDCEAVCGPGAACLPCAATCGPERGGTFCAGLAADSCDFDQ